MKGTVSIGRKQCHQYFKWNRFWKRNFELLSRMKRSMIWCSTISFIRFTLSVVFQRWKCWSPFHFKRYDSFGSIIQTNDGEKYTHTHPSPTTKAQWVWKSSIHSAPVEKEIKANNTNTYKKANAITHVHVQFPCANVCSNAFLGRDFHISKQNENKFCSFFRVAASNSKCWAIKFGTNEAKICVKWWMWEWELEWERVSELSIDMVNNLWKTRNKRYENPQHQTIFLLGKSFFLFNFPLLHISRYFRHVNVWESLADWV